MKHQEIIFGLAAQTFCYSPPELYRPTSPTVQVFRGYDDDTATVVAATTGVATVDTVDTTISQDASAGAIALSVASGTSIARNRSYLLTDANGECELVEVAGATGLSVTLRRPLVRSYSSGATFQGTRLQIAVDTTWVSNLQSLTDVLGYTDVAMARVVRHTDIAPTAAGYRLRWSYTVNGESTIGVSYADVARYQAKNLITPLDVDRLFPGWIDRIGPDYYREQGASLISEAFDAVRLDALTDAQLLRRVRDTQVLGDLVKYRANVLAMQADVMAGRRDASAYQLARDLYDQRYNALIREPKVAVDQTGAGGNGEAIRLPAFRR